MTSGLRQKLNQRVEELQRRVQDSLTYAFDRFLQENMDDFFRFEERLQEFEQLFIQITYEINATHDLYSFRRLEERLAYLEYTFDDLDHELSGRPRRRRRGFSFFDFVRQWQRERDAGIQQSEINNAQEAYETLGIEVGSNLSAVTKAFRRLIKELHPDTRGGDRTDEPRLRKLIAAYQFIKKSERVNGG
jgi:DNA repair exonuclease SbcCD ATPase subunit